MRLEFLEQDIARNLEEDVWHEENDERVVVFMLLQVKILGQASNIGVCDVDSAKTCGQVVFWNDFRVFPIESHLIIKKSSCE